MCLKGFQKRLSPKFGPNIFLPFFSLRILHKLIPLQNFFGPQDFFLPKSFWTHFFQTFFYPNFATSNILTTFFLNPIFFGKKTSLQSIFYCHTRLHLGFSAKLRIWLASASKMEPQSGIIYWSEPDPTRPDPPDPTGIVFFFWQYLKQYLIKFNYNQAQSSWTTLIIISNFFSHSICPV